MSTQETRTYVKKHPIKVGLFVVLGVIALGSLSAFSLGYGSPDAVNAQVTTVGTVTVTAPATVTTTGSTVGTVVSTVTTAVVNTVNTVVNTVTGNQNQNQNNGNGNQGTGEGSTSGEEGNEIEGVTVTAQNPTGTTGTGGTGTVTTGGETTVAPVVVTVSPQDPSNPTAPGVVSPGTGGETTVSEVVVTVNPQDPSNPSTEPCCTTPADPTEVTPLVVTLSPQTPTNPWTVPCCTLPPIIPTTPITPPIVVTPPIVPLFDMCINIDGIQTQVPTGTQRNDAGNCVTIYVPPACTLVANPTSVQLGGSSTLTWTTDNATSVSINNGVGTVATDGSVSVTPLFTTTYTLTATGAGGTVTCPTTVTVTVTPPPPPAPTCTLVAAPVAIQTGGSSILTWTTQNATSFTLDQGIGAVTPVVGGSRVVSPTQTTTYTGTATGAGGTVHCTATVTVTTTPPPLVPACTLVANPTVIQQGNTSTLTWTTQNANSFSIDQGIGAVAVTSGSRVVSPTQTTTYTGTAIGANGATVHCTATVTVTNTPPPPVPACTLTASPTTIQNGGSSTLTWTTENATTFTINQGIGQVNNPVSGSRSVSPTVTTTYTGTATGPGGTVHCTATVTVTQVTPPPACTLVANPVAVQLGGSSTLTWTTQNATTFTLDQGIGAQTFVQGGTHLVTPTQTTTYTGTATGPGGTVHCTATVTVTTNPPPPAPLCTLVANPSAIQSGGSTTLTWTTQNANSFSIDQGIGAVTPTAGGTRSVSPTQTTTYTGTATGPGGVVTCATTVTVTNTPPAPQCTLTASPTSITKGGTSTITWGGTNIASVIIDQGIGAKGATGSVNVSPTDTTTYTGTFTSTNGQTLSCAATVTVTNDDGVCTSNCGGGGGGGRKNPRVILSSLKTPDDQPLAFVYLSEMPYTGLDLGPIGTSLYWAMLALWSFAAAYLIFFNVMPFAYRRIGAFGRNVKEVMNQPAAPEPAHGHTTHVAPSAHAAPVASHAAHDTHSAHHAAPVAKAPVVEHDGFRAYASGEALTIDDIVKGLAREAAANPSASAHDISPAFMARAEEPVHHEAPAAPAPAPMVEAAMPTPRPMAEMHHATPFNDDVRVFIEALLRGDRDTVFGIIRGITRNGGDSEAFLTHAVCALDDAYRSRVDGSTCHPEILAATADCHPSFLERVVTSLTTAVDGSYSTGITGVKLALTRALAVVNG